MSEASVFEQVDRAVRAALAALKASGERVYYDAASDARARTRYYASLAGELAPGARYRR